MSLSTRSTVVITAAISAVGGVPESTRRLRPSGTFRVGAAHVVHELRKQAQLINCCGAVTCGGGRNSWGAAYHVLQCAKKHVHCATGNILRLGPPRLNGMLNHTPSPPLSLSGWAWATTQIGIGTHAHQNMLLLCLYTCKSKFSKCRHSSHSGLC